MAGGPAQQFPGLSCIWSERLALVPRQAAGYEYLWNKGGPYSIGPAAGLLMVFEAAQGSHVDRLYLAAKLGNPQEKVAFLYGR